MTEVLRTLYASTAGTSLHLDGDAVRIVQPEQNGRRLLPLSRIDHIVAFGGVTVTDDLAQRCAADGRSVTWLSGAGRFRARVVGPQAGNPLLRIAQHRTYDGPARLSVAKAFVAGKLANTRQSLLRAGRDATGERQTALRRTAEALSASLHELSTSDSLPVVMGVEGAAARRYVAGWRQLLTEHSLLPSPLARTSRPPTDAINAALSFGYGLLRVSVHGALEQVGLDPYVGMLHGVRPGKPALALDLMEEFRPLLVDRLVFGSCNRRQLTPEHFHELPGGAVELTEAGRRIFLSLWSDARTRAWPHPRLQSPVPAAVLPLVQARILARHVRGDLPSYLPWSPA